MRRTLPTTGGADIDKYAIGTAGSDIINAFDDWLDATFGSPDEQDAAVRLLAAIHRYHPELGDRPAATGELPGDRPVPDSADLATGYDRQFLRDIARYFQQHGDGAIRQNARLYLRAASDRD